MTKTDELLTRGVAEIIEEKSLKAKLKSGKKLRVKFGIDPTGPDIHLGHTIPLIKLRQFQDLGHKAVLILGDYTGTVGDPSGKDSARSALSYAQVKKNADGYLSQAFRILDKKKTEVRYNSEWFKKMTFLDVLQLVAKTSLGQLMAHETFRKRMESDENSLSAHEILYPLMQGYDSVMVKSDVELGGLDQKFNLLMGRKLQKDYGQKPQEVFMVKYIRGLDGKEKMSKSLGNYIAVNDAPEVIFGKVMSISDELIPEYTELLTDLPVKKIKKGVSARAAKAELATAIVERFYNKKDAESAEKSFNKVFKEHKIPDEIPTVKTAIMSCLIVEVLAMTQLVSSKGEGRRMIEQGAVKVDGQIIKKTDERMVIHGGEVLQVGKRRFVKLVV